MKHSFQSATQFINKRNDHLQESKLQCKYNQCHLEQQPKETLFYFKVTSLILCFMSNSSVHPQLLLKIHVYVQSEVHAFSPHTAYFINTSLCVGKGVCKVFVRTHRLYIWAQMLRASFEGTDTMCMGANAHITSKVFCIYNIST